MESDKLHYKKKLTKTEELVALYDVIRLTKSMLKDTNHADYELHKKAIENYKSRIKELREELNEKESKWNIYW